MNDCDQVKELLVLNAEGELSARESRDVSDHLQKCAPCADELARLQAVRAYLADPELFLPDNISWDAIPRSIAAHAQTHESFRGWIPANFNSLGWAGSIAASLILTIGVIWMLQRAAPLTQSTVAAVQGNRDFLRQMQSAQAREAAARYLAECQDLLLNVVRAEQTCTGDKYDVSSEVTRARELLQRKRLLDVELRAPEVSRAKELCDELENVLMSLSMSETCETPDKLQSLERFIQKEQLLLRINLIQSELS